MCPPTSSWSSWPRGDPKPINPALAKHYEAPAASVQNKQLIELSNQILELTKLIHDHTKATQSVKQ